MIIAISGLTGSGKNTLGEALSEITGLKLVSPTFKDLAAKEGVSLMEFQKKAEKNKNIDLKFDEVLKAQVNEAKKHGGCIVTTWLGPWIVDADLRVYIDTPIGVRAERIAKRDGMTLPEGKKHVKERDDQNRKRYLKVYGIDIYNTANFDLHMNSGSHTPKEMARQVLELAKKKKIK